MLIQKASWITMEGAASTAVPVFRKKFDCGKPVRSAVLEVTCDGVYEAVLNGRRVGNFILAPGWTEYRKRLQVQSYDVTELLEKNNTLEITVANGWFRRTNAPWTGTKNPDEFLPAMLIAALRLVREDGSEEHILTDGTWEASESTVTLSGIFIGEDVDMTREPCFEPARICDFPKENLIPQEGPEVHEQETVYPRASFRTPRGEWVIDFGQNLTGYMAFETDARAGFRICRYGRLRMISVSFSLSQKVSVFDRNTSGSTPRDAEPGFRTDKMLF